MRQATDFGACERVTNEKGHSRGALPCKGPKQSGVELMAATLDWWSGKAR